MMPMIAQATLKQIDETASLIQSHGWGLTAIALVVVLMLVLFGVFMFDSRNREKRYVDESREREEEMKGRIQHMEDRQFSDMVTIANGYNRAITEQTAVCRELSIVMEDTTKELAACRQSREAFLSKARE